MGWCARTCIPAASAISASWCCRCCWRCRSIAAYRGRDFIAAAVVGYEVGGQIGRAVMDAEVANIHRPTGITGPVAAAAAGARLLALDVEAATSAIALGANTTVGLQPVGAYRRQRNVLPCRLRRTQCGERGRVWPNSGAFASPSALDGEAGLFAALGNAPRQPQCELFTGEPEILSVYHKPVPACNFAQTACQAALQLLATQAVAAGSHRRHHGTGSARGRAVSGLRLHRTVRACPAGENEHPVQRRRGADLRAA